MMIYEHRTSMTTVAGTISTVSLKIPGGLLRNVLVRANTDTTVFRFNLKDDNGVTRLNYGFMQGELVDETITMPLSGAYTATITNASPNDVFQIILGVQE
jgi:hypothetical protein